MEGFQYDAHPMGIFLSTVGALSTIYPDAKRIRRGESRRLQIRRLIAKVPTHRRLRLPAQHRPAVRLSGQRPELHRQLPEHAVQDDRAQVQGRNPVLERALDVLFILHADHEQNCSTSAMRGIGSSQADPYSALAGAAAALYGPLHGGANEAVLRMLKEIGSVKHVPDFITRVKRGEGRLMGFGHRVYKSYDPRARIIKQTADEVFEVTGTQPAARHRARARADRARRRLLRHAQALPERRFLLRADLPGDGLPGRHVPRALRDSAHGRLAGAVGRDAARRRSEDRPAAPDLHRARSSATTSRATNRK